MTDSSFPSGAMNGHCDVPLRIWLRLLLDFCWGDQDGMDLLISPIARCRPPCRELHSNCAAAGYVSFGHICVHCSQS